MTSEPIHVAELAQVAAIVSKLAAERDEARAERDLHAERLRLALSVLRLRRDEARAERDRARDLAAGLEERLSETERVVRDIHRPAPICGDPKDCPEPDSHTHDYNNDGDWLCFDCTTGEAYCEHCYDDDGSFVDYPCPTIRALDALNPEAEAEPSTLTFPTLADCGLQ